MRHILFKENSANKYKIALLVKESSFRKDLLHKYYMEPLLNKGISEDSIIALSLTYNEVGKCPSSLQKESLKTLLKAVESLEVNTLLVADPNYFKTLTGVTKVDPQYGYILPCKIKSYEYLNCILTANYQGIFYNPELQNKLTLGLDTLINHIQGTHTDIGSDIIKYEYYPDSIESIKTIINSLHQYPNLCVDTETFSLKHYESGIGTIAFAWSKHEGVSFCVDYVAYSEPTEIQIWIEEDNKYVTKLAYGYQEKNHELYKALREFFETYQGNIKFHNASFDIGILIYNLWMTDITDHHGLYIGLDVMTKNFDCTQVITYLATNSCAGNKLSLKDQAHEFAGNWANSDINDIRLIPKPKLLTYNLIDTLSTWFVYEKNYPTVIQDKQEEVYLGLMKESLITIIQMQLTGMPMCMDRVIEAKQELGDIYSKHLDNIMCSPVVDKTLIVIKEKYLIKDFENRKNKAKNPDKIKPKLLENISLAFNPNSGDQVATLLHEVMGLPIIETTKTGLPATDEDTLKALVNHTSNEEYKNLIQDILGLNKVNKILTTFIPAFEKAQLGKDGIHYLFGSFKIGGTKSNRLSSANPNLTNLPAGSKYGKIIKSCFKTTNEWIFCGADYMSLEDMINSLLTKDPNKLKIYIDKYDSHSFRTKAYWPELFTHLGNTPEEVNSIKDTHETIRSASKAPTFALTFGGTFITLMKNCGFSEEEAKRIEANYHKLYTVSDDWVADKLKQASIDGYVTLAFGVRLRTPMLKQVIWDSSSMPYEASAEGRTAGNAVSGQSYGSLTMRAANELIQRLRLSPFKYDIKICAIIHDAVYFLVRNNIDAVHWLNINLIECMQWQELPEIQHDQVKLGAELDLFYPSWKDKLTLANKLTKEEILKLCKPS